LFYPAKIWFYVQKTKLKNNRSTKPHFMILMVEPCVFHLFCAKKNPCRLEPRKAPRPNDWTLAREMTAAAEEPSGQVWETTVENMS
jgi:hypothetical protein